MNVGDTVVMLGEPTHLSQITHISEQAAPGRRMYRLQSLEVGKHLDRYDYYARWLFEGEFRATTEEELTALRLMK